MKFFKKKHLNISTFKHEKNYIAAINIGNYGICFQKTGIFNFLQFKALIFFLKKKLKFYSKLYLRINLVFKTTKKAIGVRMGKGKGGLDMLYSFVRKGQVFMEFGFKSLSKDLLSNQNLNININNLNYFNKKVNKIVNLASTKISLKLKLYKNFK